MIDFTFNRKDFQSLIDLVKKEGFIVFSGIGPNLHGGSRQLCNVPEFCTNH
jgi:hypothetical protein